MMISPWAYWRQLYCVNPGSNKALPGWKNEWLQATIYGSNDFYSA